MDGAEEEITFSSLNLCLMNDCNIDEIHFLIYYSLFPVQISYQTFFFSISAGGEMCVSRGA